MIQQFPRRAALRRLTATVAATALAAPCALFTVSAQAASGKPSSETVLVEGPGGPSDALDPYQSDSHRSFGPEKYLGGLPSPYGRQAGVTATLDTSDASTKQSQGVVMISTVVDFGSGGAAGTGMVLDGTDGIVVTNHHVVQGSTSLTVTVPAGATYTAEVLGTDANHDVAVLRLQGAPSLVEVTTDSAPLAVGDSVTAVGDAGGDGGTLTAAAGTVTDPHEPVTVSNDDGSQTTIRNLIEVDADIVSGDSGGALLDADGDVVGMNVAASSGADDITGYAIPVRRVLQIAEAVLAGDEAATISLGYDAFLGVQLTPGPATIAGVLDGGAAAEAGLGSGDTVTAVDGSPTPTTAALQRAIAAREAGDLISLSWTDAAGDSHRADVTLGQAPVR